MVDLTRQQGEALPPTMQSRYIDLGEGSHALLVAVVQAGLMISGEAIPWPIDEITGNLKTIDTPHAEVHEGEYFEASYMSPHGSEIANDATIMLLLQVGILNEMHYNFSVASGGDAEVEIVRNPVITDAGPALRESNLHDGSNRNTTVTASHTPIVVGGTIIVGPIFVPGGSGPKASGGQVREALERIGRRSRNYLIRATNRSGNAQMMSIHVQWYDHLP